MEKIVINFMIYKCKKGTNATIKDLLHKAEKSGGDNTSEFNAYNSFLWNIIETKKGTYVEEVYRTN